MTEMFWADLSHGRGLILARLSSLIELFLEAPFVLGRAFLGGNVGRFENMIRKLILASNWIMRWPIAGLNASIFSACFAAMVLRQFDRLDLLPLVVIAALLAVAAIGLLSSSQLRHRRPGLADIGLASLVSALGLAVVVAVAWALGHAEAMRSPPTYLAISIRLILFFWFLWTALNVTAVILLTLVGAKRWLQRKPKEDTGTLSSRSVPLSRPAAAVGLGVMIGIVWKLVLSVLGILVVANLGIAGGRSLEGCAYELSLLEIVMGSADVCQMTYAEQQLVNVRPDLDIAAAITVALSIFLVVRWRRVRVATYSKAALDGTLVLPRLIAHPLIIATLFVVAVVNAGVFYILPLALGAEVPVRFRDFIFDSGLDATLPPALGLVLFAVVLIYVAESSDSDVHIGRDLVDHQYFRDPGWGSVKLQAALSRFVFRISGGKWGSADPVGSNRPQEHRGGWGARSQLSPAAQDPAPPRGPDRRRDKCQRRRSPHLLCSQPGHGDLERLLNDHDDLVDAAHHARESLKGVKRIDVLTIGSPLKHIYEHYYGDYEPPSRGTKVLDVDSWTNIWRVDDPIGQDINPTACSKDGMICNIGIGPGGHEDYWREVDVLAVLWSLIENRPRRTMPEV